MKRRILIFFCTIIIALTFSNCTTYRASGLSYGDPKSEELGSFERKVTVWKFIGESGGPTLFNATQRKTEKALTNVLDEEISKKGGNGVKDLSIIHEASFFNILLNSITWSLVAPVKLKVSGTVVKYPNEQDNNQ